MFNKIRFENAIKKNGFKIEAGHNERNFRVTGQKYYGCYYIQNDSAHCVSVCRIGEKPDSMYDHHPELYMRSIKSFISYLQK